jgi:SPP1 gp7 family putative phage head morphogenesis protein
MVKELRYTPAMASKMVRLPLTDEMVEKYPWLDEEPPQKQAGGFAQEPKQISEKLIEKSFKKGEKLTEDERIALSWDYIHKVLDPGEKNWKKALDQFFTRQANMMQDNVDAWLKKQKAIPEKVDREVYLIGFWKQIIIDPSQFMLNPNEENEKLIKKLTPLIADQMKRDADRLKDELGTLIEFNVTDENIQQYINERKEIIKGINTTTFKKANKKIGLAIEEAMNENATPQEAAKLVKEAIRDVKDVRKNQAQTIARTETATISNQTRFKAFHQEGIEYHEWLTAGDERVRPDHVQVGGTIVKIGQTFPIVNIKYPNDPNGAPEQIINCRCVSIPAEEPKG